MTVPTSACGTRNRCGDGSSKSEKQRDGQGFPPAEDLGWGTSGWALSHSCHALGLWAGPLSIALNMWLYCTYISTEQTRLDGALVPIAQDVQTEGAERRVGPTAGRGPSLGRNPIRATLIHRAPAQGSLSLTHDPSPRQYSGGQLGRGLSVSRLGQLPLSPHPLPGGGTVAGSCGHELISAAIFIDFCKLNTYPHRSKLGENHHQSGRTALREADRTVCANSVTLPAGTLLFGEGAVALHLAHTAGEETQRALGSSCQGWPGSFLG